MSAKSVDYSLAFDKSLCICKGKLSRQQSYSTTYIENSLECGSQDNEFAIKDNGTFICRASSVDIDFALTLLVAPCYAVTTAMASLHLG